MHTLADWTWCCWLPLIGGGDGCTSWRIGCGDVAGCHCWAAIAGDRAGVGVYVGGLDVVPLLGAIAGLPLLAAVYTLADWTWWLCWLPLMGAIAGCHCWGCHCWAPLLGAIAGDRRRGGCTRWHVVPLLGAIAGDRGGFYF